MLHVGLKHVPMAHAPCAIAKTGRHVLVIANHTQSMLVQAVTARAPVAVGPRGVRSDAVSHTVELNEIGVVRHCWVHEQLPTVICNFCVMKRVPHPDYPTLSATEVNKAGGTIAGTVGTTSAERVAFAEFLDVLPTLFTVMKGIIIEVSCKTAVNTMSCTIARFTGQVMP